MSLRQAEASLKQANVSQQELKLASRLTLVALVFIPLSFTASIFSMGGDSPWQLSFWVHFAMALPMTAIVDALAWMARGRTEGYECCNGQQSTPVTTVDRFLERESIMIQGLRWLARSLQRI